jgi:hypothetical protein
MDTLVLNDKQNLIITLLRKSKPEFVFDISMGEHNVPEIIMEYGIVSNVPEDADPATIITEPQKYKIPLDETATWANIKKLIDIFEKYLKNADLNKKPVIDVSAQILQLEFMKEKAAEWNDVIKNARLTQN